MKNYTVLLIALFLFTISCHHVAQKADSINGVWESIGSGWLLEISDSTDYTFYDITSISCLSTRAGDFNEIQASLTLENDSLSLLKGVITYKFIRRSGIPETCFVNANKEKVGDPLYNFEVFAETVQEHYAFMELNNIDWDKLYNKQRSKLNLQSTDAELYVTIDETLEALHDNHAFLEASDEVEEVVDKLFRQRQESVEKTASDLRDYGDFQVAKMVVDHHLQEEMTDDSWLLHWGKLNDSIGYIQVKAMWLYGDLDISAALIEEVGYVNAYVETFHALYEGDYIQQEVQGVSTVMDKVMRDLSYMDAIVIDVRFNGGGQDAVSFEILSRFISEKRQVGTQKLRFGDQFSPVLPLYINGSSDAYVKPVYILTSQQTGSAAEAFAIATISMDHMKRIGAPSSGAMSTALEKKLPNGWFFAISNEIYMDNQGVNYENVGIPVDYNLNYPADRQVFFRSVVDDLEVDKKNILEAIRVLSEK